MAEEPEVIEEAPNLIQPEKPRYENEPPPQAEGGFTRPNASLAETVASQAKPRFIEAVSSPQVRKYYIHRRSLQVYPIGQADPFGKMPDYVPITKEEVDALEYNRRRLLKQFATLKNCHPHATIHVLGNGPSLNSTISKIERKEIVIATNAAFKLAPAAQYWLTCMDLHDTKHELHNECAKYFKEPNGETKKIISKYGWFNYMECSPYAIFEKGDRANGLFWDGSSAHAATHLAIFMGADNIILHGIDYQNRGHFYTSNDPKDQPDKQWDDFNRHVQGWMNIQRIANEARVSISNANWDSKLVTFPNWEKGRHVDPQISKINLVSGGRTDLPAGQVPGQPPETIQLDPHLQQLSEKFKQQQKEKEHMVPDGLGGEMPIHPDGVFYDLEGKELSVWCNGGEHIIPFDKVDKYLLQSVKKLKLLVDSFKTEV